MPISGTVRPSPLLARQGHGSEALSRAGRRRVLGVRRVPRSELHTFLGQPGPRACGLHSDLLFISVLPGTLSRRHSRGRGDKDTALKTLHLSLCPRLRQVNSSTSRSRTRTATPCSHWRSQHIPQWPLSTATALDT